MRKSGKPKASGKSGLSVYERHEKQKQAQVDKGASRADGEAESSGGLKANSQDIELNFSDDDSRSKLVREVDRQTAVGKHPSGRRAESDVELSFSEEEEEDNPGSSEQVTSPQKSPKLTKAQSPNSHSPRKTKQEARGDHSVGEEARTKQRKSSKKGREADQPQKQKGKKASRNETDGPKARKSLDLTEQQAQPSSLGAHQGVHVLEAQLEPLNQDEIRAGLAEVLPGLRERLVHPSGGGRVQMVIRPSLQQVQEKLETLLGNTVDIPGENNSVLLVGPRGVGKTLAVERAASRLQERFNTDRDNPRVGFVRLTGLAHTDERAAFKEIARQLCRTFNCQFSKQASLEDNLGFLRDMLKELRRGHKVVIFELDEFDLFARKPKQTLLYNLLDAMQASDMQAAVVGMSCRSDVTEMLEKRVKSRFSYRRQLVLDPCTSDFHNPQEGPPAILASLLAATVQPDDRQASTAAFAQHFDRSAGQALQDVQVQDRLQGLCDKGCGSPRELGKIASLAVCSMRMEEVLLQPRHLLQAIAAVDTAPGCQVEAVAGLSILELFLLVALCRLTRKGVSTPNFQMAFDEYSSLRRGGSYRGVDETASKPSAFRAFERLLSASLVAYTDARAEGRGGLREYNPISLLLTPQELEDGLQCNRNFPSVLLEWLKKDAIASHAADD